MKPPPLIPYIFVLVYLIVLVPLVGCRSIEIFENSNRNMYKIYYESYGIPDLFTYEQDEKDTYIRLWFTKDFTDPVIYTFQYENELWNGFCLKKNGKINKLERIPIFAKQKTWEFMWKKLSNINFIGIDDWSQTNCFHPPTIEGWTVDVELLIAHRYRNFRYHNPEIRFCPEAQSFTRALSIIFKDLKIPAFFLAAVEG